MNLNPETNPKLRAVLYVIGAGGLLHLLTLLAVAIHKGDASYFNPLVALDFDQLWPSIHNSWFWYITGWAVFTGMIVFIYRRLPRK